jgi:DNA primase
MPDGKRWKCFGCGKSGDAIDWLMQRQRMTFREAVQLLGRESDAWRLALPFHSTLASKNTSASLPDSDWQSRARSSVEVCHRVLFSSDGDQARAWLHARGLQDKTLRRWRLGYSAQDQALFGHFIPRGIVIPWEDDQAIRCVKVRRPHERPKYVCVRGSLVPGVFLSQAIRPSFCTLVVEGEFDALLGWQLVSDLVNVITIGSASQTPDSQTIVKLIGSPLIFLCYDSDQAGARGAERWSGLSGRVRVVSFPSEKDLTDFSLGGGDARAWVGALLRDYLTDGPDTRQLAQLL